MQPRVLAALLVVGAAMPAAAQTGPIALTIVSDADSTPLRRAKVVAVTSGNASPPVHTDDDGRVAVTVRAAADLQISKAGFALRSVRVTPAAGRVEIRLAPAAVITGRVTGTTGEPAARAIVILRRLEPTGAAIHADARTDDRGEYRFGKLARGNYEVFTQDGRTGDPLSDAITVSLEAGQHADVPLTATGPVVEFPYADGGAVAGTIVDEFGEPREGARVTLVALGSAAMGDTGPPVLSDDLGRYRIYHVPPERYLLVVSSDVSPPQAPGARATVRIGVSAAMASAYLPVYYPGRLDPADAQPLMVERAREIHGIDVTAAWAAGVRVRGHVGPAGGGEPMQVFLRPTSGRAASVMGTRSATAAADGTFEFQNVPPGAYNLQALSPVVYDKPTTISDFRFASMPLAVGSDDVGPVALTPRPTSTIRGHITLEEVAGGVSPADFKLAVLPADGSAPEPRLTSGAVRISEGAEPRNWTFQVAGLAAPSRVGLQRAPRGWWLKAVRVGGVNAVEDAASFGSSADSRDDVEIVLSATAGILSGRLTGNRPVETYQVVAFATDPQWWFEGSGRVLLTTSRSDGTFVLPTVPPGQYLAAAVEYTELDPSGDDVLRPETLSRLAASATRVTVAERVEQRVELRLIEGSR